MTPRERGFLLLTSHLGDPERKVLSQNQLRMLAVRAREMELPSEERDLTEGDLVQLGCDRELCRKILDLLAQDALLDAYLQRAKGQGCVPVTRVSESYPALLRQRLGLDSPGCLWARGDLELLNTPKISLVGSRELGQENLEFARAVGYQAAVQGLTLVSGNARGADRAAQEACIRAGGRVISIVADRLYRTPPRNMLFLSEDGYDEDFSAQRALSRNRCIHAMGQIVFVAQCDLHRGGTWSGTVKNLRYGWSPVVCFRDGSDAMSQLEQMGAYQIGLSDLQDFTGFQTF